MITPSPGFRLQVSSATDKKLTLSDASVSDLMIVATDGPLRQSILAGFSSFGSNPSSSVLRIDSADAAGPASVSVEGTLYAKNFSLLGGGTIGGVWNSTSSGATVVLGSNVGIGTSNPLCPLDVVGNIRATGNIIAAGFRLAGGVHASSLVGATLTSCRVPYSSMMDAPWKAASNGSVVVHAGSNVGIGTDAPAFPLDVVGSIRATGNIIAGGFRLAGGGVHAASLVGATLSSCRVPYTDMVGAPWRVHPTGSVILLGSNLGIGTSDPRYILDVVGTVRASGGFLAFSDERHKTDLATISDPVSKVRGMTGYTYRMRTDAPHAPRQMGVLAQDVRRQVPELVQGDDEAGLSVAYGNMVALLIEAIKSLDGRLACLEARHTQHPGCS